MLNIDFFISRLNQIMLSNNLNSASFAEQIGVQRSSVSHIMSKRNKPSLDFILKINNFLMISNHCFGHFDDFSKNNLISNCKNSFK